MCIFRFVRLGLYVLLESGCLLGGAFVFVFIVSSLEMQNFPILVDTCLVVFIMVNIIFTFIYIYAIVVITA